MAWPGRILAAGDLPCRFGAVLDQLHAPAERRPMRPGDLKEIQLTERLELGHWFTIEENSGKLVWGRFLGYGRDGKVILDYKGTGILRMLSPSEFDQGVIRKGVPPAWAHRIGPSEDLELRAEDGYVWRGNLLSFNRDGTARAYDRSLRKIVQIDLRGYQLAPVTEAVAARRAAETLPAPRRPTAASSVAAFEGVEPYRYEIGEVMQSSLPVLTSSGSTEYPPLFTSGQGAAYARKRGLIYEGVPITELPRGQAYNYVLLEGGRWVFGRRTDVLELGVKHVQLAEGRGVLCAGEVLIEADGRVRINDESGSYSAFISVELGQRDFRRRVQAAFEAQGVQPTWDLKKIRAKALTREQLDFYCLQPVFSKQNPHLCPH